jgi:hypothetical protein
MKVVAEMMAQHMIGELDQPSALIIAPPTSLVAKIAWQTDAALRVVQQPPLPFSRMNTRNDNEDLTSAHTGDYNNNNKNDRIHVVHGSYDHAFCPNQERWESSGATFHVLPDNHVFLTRLSIQSLVTLLDSLVTQGLNHPPSGH